MVTKSVAKILFVSYGCLITCSSLYPFEFLFHPRAPHLFWIPISNQRLWFDVVLNIAFYVPLGALGFLAFARGWRGALLAFSTGIGLSWAMEFLQLWSTSRYGGLTDLTFNSLGTAFGVIAVALVTKGSSGSEKLAPSRASRV